MSNYKVEIVKSKLKEMLGEVTLDEYKNAINILDKDGWPPLNKANESKPYWVYDKHGKKKKYPVKMVMRKLLELKKTEYDDNTMYFTSKNAERIIKESPQITEYGIDFTDNKGESEKNGGPDTPNLNQILYGPPGTGKTYNTIIEAIKILEKDLYMKYKAGKTTYEDLKTAFEGFKEQGRIEFVTFHQSYSYEEFVEGIRPVIKNNEKNERDIQFEYHDGIFKKMCINARNNPDKKFVLIIDEINRGNISKIFGELITLIEPDKRENVTGDESEYHTIEVTLPYSNEKFTVPNNLYIIGTMNTADKSLTLLDTALRRRFEFIPMYPNIKAIKPKELRNFLDKLNTNILKKKNNNADYLIGHSYFIGKEKKDLKDILNKNVIPLLMEYFNGDIKTVKDDILNSCGYTLTYDSDYSVDGKGEKYFYLQVEEVK